MEIQSTSDAPSEAAKPPEKPTVGDVVRYVPHEIHARERDHNGDYPWVFGRKVRGRKGGDEVEEVDGGAQTTQMLEGRRGSQGRNLDGPPILLRPRSFWPATVKAVNEDGTYRVDIYTKINPYTQEVGVTLHYDGVPLDPTGKKPHTINRS